MALVNARRFGLRNASEACLRRATINENNSPHSTPEQDVLNALLVPLKIFFPCGVERPCNEAPGSNWDFGSGAEPLMYLGVPIGEGEATRAVVVGGWSISPLTRSIADDEKAVIDRIGMFVHRDPGHRRRVHIRSFEKLFVLGHPPVHSSYRGIQ